LGIHADRNIGMNEAGCGPQLRPRGQQALDLRPVAEQNEFHIGVALERQLSPRNDNRSPMVAAHGIKRDANPMRHERTQKTVTAAAAASAVLREQLLDHSVPAGNTTGGRWSLYPALPPCPPRRSRASA